MWELYVGLIFLWELWVILEVIEFDCLLYWWNMGIIEKFVEVLLGDVYIVGYDIWWDKRWGVIVKVYLGDGLVNEVWLKIFN